jgi:hypothetical protein
MCHRRIKVKGFVVFGVMEIDTFALRIYIEREARTQRRSLRMLGRREPLAQYVRERARKQASVTFSFMRYSAVTSHSLQGTWNERTGKFRIALKSSAARTPYRLSLIFIDRCWALGISFC